MNNLIALVAPPTETPTPMATPKTPTPTPLPPAPTETQEPPTATPEPINTPSPTSPPTPTFTPTPPISALEVAENTQISENSTVGEINVEYPIRMSPGSSETVFASIFIPDRLASLIPIAIARVEIPPDAPPIIRQFKLYQAVILVQEKMRVELSSPTFVIESLSPAIQQINFEINGEPTYWGWSIVAPNAVGRHVLTVQVYLGNDQSPSWIRSLQVEIVELTPTSVPTSTLTPTNVPMFILVTSTPPLTPTYISTHTLTGISTPMNIPAAITDNGTLLLPRFIPRPTPSSSSVLDYCFISVIIIMSILGVAYIAKSIFNLIRLRRDGERIINENFRTDLELIIEVFPDLMKSIPSVFYEVIITNRTKRRFTTSDKAKEAANPTTLSDREDEVSTLRTHLAKHRFNLRKLEEQKANFGIQVPISLINEIEHEKHAIAELEAKLAG